MTVRRVYVESLLPCSVEQAWDAIQSSALLLQVTPAADARAIVEPRPMPPRWTDARRIVLRLPRLGVRTIDVVLVDDEGHRIQTREHDSVVTRWDHTMQVRPAPGGRTYYSDAVEIEAGAFTLPVWAVAQFLYRYRHRGWRRIARELAARPSDAQNPTANQE